MSTEDALQAVRDRRDALAALADSDLRTSEAAADLLEAAGANYKCTDCGGYLQSADARNTFECVDCGTRIREEGA